MALELITADFFTNQHRVRGRVFTADRRLTDVLNDQLYSSLELSEVEVARVIEPEKVVYSYPSLFLMKGAIVFALLTGASNDSGESRLSRYVEKKPHDILFTLPPYEISGKVYLRGTGDPRTLIIREAGYFLPLTQAQVVFTLFPKVKFSGEVAIVNKALLEIVGAVEVSDTIP